MFHKSLGIGLTLAMLLFWAMPVIAKSQTFPREVELSEIIVVPQKYHYSKKNNPAVSLVDSLRLFGKESNPRNRDNYNYEKYERITIALNDINEDKNLFGGEYSFLKDFVDSSAITGKKIMPVSVKEKVSEVHYRKNPKAEREYIMAFKSNGLDEIIDSRNVQTYLEDIFREIDLYENNIDILSNLFVSPLSSLGPDFYKYFLGDTVKVDDELCRELIFMPRNEASFGFQGKIYVPVEGDNSFIKRVEISLPKEANLNFVEALNITQNFERGVGGERLKISDILTVEFALIPGTQGLYVQRSSKLTGHHFGASDKPQLFDRDVSTVMSASAYLHDENFWNYYRNGTVGVSENDIAEMMASLRGIKSYRVAETIMQILMTGYVHTGRDSKVDLGPINTLVSFNDVEGARFRLGGLTTASLNPRLFGSGYIAYGTKDRKLKYNAEVEYSFIDKHHYAREFPINSLRLSYRYDIDHLGQNFIFTNPDNLFLSLRRAKDNFAIYRREAKVDYMIEFENKLSVNIELSHQKNYATKFVPFEFLDGKYLNTFNNSFARLTLRYAPDEKYYQTPTQRIEANSDAPVFILSHTYAPDNLFGNRFAINKTEFNFKKRFWFSAFGYTDVIAKAAHVWSKTPFLYLLSPNSNLSYTIQPETFDLVNPMEFINDTQVSIFLTYWANGAIFNYVPLLKKLKLREVIGLRAAWGNLSDKNRPELHPELPLFPSSTSVDGMKWSCPYAEVSVGIDNIFRLFRLDYVWRLTYRSNPGISRSGLRVGLHLTF